MALKDDFDMMDEEVSDANWLLELLREFTAPLDEIDISLQKAVEQGKSVAPYTETVH